MNSLDLDAILADNLRRARVCFGYTQAEVAEMLNVSVSTISSMENGKTKVLFTTVAEYSDLFHLKLEYFTIAHAVPQAFLIDADDLDYHGPYCMKKDMREIAEEFQMEEEQPAEEEEPAEEENSEDDMPAILMRIEKKHAKHQSETTRSILQALRNLEHKR